MAEYAIGDLQGCFDEWMLLLDKIQFDSQQDTLFLMGDLVNRGPKSLEVLRFAYQNQSAIKTILGNHDLHLLAVAYGNGKIKKNDTIQSILNAPDCDELLNWLRHQPLMRQHKNYLMVHAGLLPEWSAELALKLAQEAHETLSSDRFKEALMQMYGNTPYYYSKNLKGIEKFRLILNVMTRMRAITPDGKLDFDFKSTYTDIPKPLIAWFDAKKRQYSTNHTVLFGHWSALGFYQARNTICLDSGALWGGELTAFNLENKSITQISSINGLAIKV